MSSSRTLLALGYACDVAGIVGLITGNPVLVVFFWPALVYFAIVIARAFA